jgi:hypothetical protein
VFSHTYAVEGVGRDEQGVYVTVRNPWGLDNRSDKLGQLSAADRSFFTAGSESDGLVRVRWNTFTQAFATYVAVMA